MGFYGVQKMDVSRVFLEGKLSTFSFIQSSFILRHVSDILSGNPRVKDE